MNDLSSVVFINHVGIVHVDPGSPGHAGSLVMPFWVRSLVRQPLLAQRTRRARHLCCDPNAVTVTLTCLLSQLIAMLTRVRSISGC